MATSKAVIAALELRDAYRQTFRSESGKKVMSDLIRKTFIISPIGSNADETLINVGRQETVRWLLSKALGNDRALDQAIRDAYTEQNQTPNE